MPDTCSVYGCANRSNRDKEKRFFRIPKEVIHKGDKNRDFTKRRRARWLANLSLSSKGVESPNARVCSDHFVKGRPSKLFDQANVDWAPTLNMGHQKIKGKSLCAVNREKRGASRQANVQRNEVAHALLELQAQPMDCGDNPPGEHVFDETMEVFMNGEEKGCQTDMTWGDIEATEKELRRLNCELFDLKAKALESKLSKSSFETNDEKCKFYTGIPNFLVLMQVFSMCESFISHTKRSALEKFEQMILVLMRLRLNLPLQDLAYRFGISVPTASRIWNKWVDVLYIRLNFLIEWPERDTLRDTMPLDFRVYFGKKVAVIIDCFEVFIERPSNLLARAQTWSNYKHHNTVKFLIGITPQGTISFISQAWGGRASDKKITEECGILKNLLPGDIVLADRGFNIEENVSFYGASLKIPAFTKGKTQLSPHELEETRKIANVRIHVERVIGLVRRKYLVLQSKGLPTDYMNKTPGQTLTLIDKIGTICCALTNLSESVIPLE